MSIPEMTFTTTANTKQIRRVEKIHIFESYHVHVSKVIFIDGEKPLPYSSMV